MTHSNKKLLLNIILYFIFFNKIFAQQSIEPQKLFLSFNSINTNAFLNEYKDTLTIINKYKSLYKTFDDNNFFYKFKNQKDSNNSSCLSGFSLVNFDKRKEKKIIFQFQGRTNFFKYEIYLNHLKYKYIESKEKSKYYLKEYSLKNKLNVKFILPPLKDINDLNLKDSCYNIIIENYIK